VLRPAAESAKASVPRRVIGSLSTTVSDDVDADAADDADEDADDDGSHDDYHPGHGIDRDTE